MHVLFLLSTLVKIFSRPVNSLLSRFTLKRSVLDYDVFSTNNGIPRKNFGKQNKFMRIKINNRKRDSEDYQSFVSEDFYFGFWFWMKFLAVCGFLRFFGRFFCLLQAPTPPLMKTTTFAPFAFLRRIDVSDFPETQSAKLQQSVSGEEDGLNSSLFLFIFECRNITISFNRILFLKHNHYIGNHGMCQ